MRIYKIIKQISINDGTGERKERYVLIQTYTTFIERIVSALLMESQNPVWWCTLGGIKRKGDNEFNTLEEAREYKKGLEKPLETYTHEEEVVE